MSREKIRFKEYIKDVNADGESLRDIFKKLADDYYTFGNAYLEGVIYDGGLNLYHIDATTVRMSKEKKEIYVHPDWARYNTMKEKLTIIPIYPSVRRSRFVIQFKDYEPTFQFYGFPVTIAYFYNSRWLKTIFKFSVIPFTYFIVNSYML